jgi:hypothetical protein
VLNVSGGVFKCINAFDCGWDKIILNQLYAGEADIVLGLVPQTDSIVNGDLGVYWVGAEIKAGISIIFRCEHDASFTQYYSILIRLFSK